MPAHPRVQPVPAPHGEQANPPPDVSPPPETRPARALIESTGAILAGRDGYDSTGGNLRPYGGEWTGPVFVLTHHPEDLRTADGATAPSCSVAEAVRSGAGPAGR